MTEENGPYADIVYGYANVGNRLTRTVTGAVTGGGTTLVNGTTTNAYDANDRITTVNGSVSHSYDADGNETTVNGKLAAYDFENHLVGLGGGATSYVYDADGNRVSVTSGGVATGYVVDASLPYASVVEEYSGTTLANGTLAARYDYGDDLIRMDRGTVGSQVASYYLFDGLGSTRQLVNTSGTVTDTWGYSAFGELASRTGSTVNSFLFNAQQFDQPTGTYFLRARYYDQSNGRFLSQDPLEGSNEDPISLHRYLYANTDPINFSDPSGRESLGEVLIANSISVGLGATAGSFVGGAIYSTHGGSGIAGVISGAELGSALAYAVFGNRDRLLPTLVGTVLGLLAPVILDGISASLRGRDKTPQDLEDLHNKQYIDGFAGAAGGAFAGAFGNIFDGDSGYKFAGLLSVGTDVLDIANDALSGKLTEQKFVDKAFFVVVDYAIAYYTAKLAGTFLKGPSQELGDDLEKLGRDESQLTEKEKKQGLELGETFFASGGAFILSRFTSPTKDAYSGD